MHEYLQLLITVCKHIKVTDIVLTLRESGILQHKRKILDSLKFIKLLIRCVITKI